MKRERDRENGLGKRMNSMHEGQEVYDIQSSVRASGFQCQSRNSLGFDPSILQNSGILGVAEVAALNNVCK